MLLNLKLTIVCVKPASSPPHPFPLFLSFPRSLIIQRGKSTLDPVALSGFGLISCLLFMAKLLRAECSALNGSCVCFAIFSKSSFYVHPCVVYCVLQMKSPASGPPCKKAGRVYPTQGLQSKGIKIRLKFSPICW